MGIFKKLKNGGKTYYKVYSKCSNPDHSKIILTSSKDGDFEKNAKNKNKELLDKIFGEAHCDKCTINVDKLGEDSNIKKAKKIYTYIEC